MKKYYLNKQKLSFGFVEAHYFDETKDDIEKRTDLIVFESNEFPYDIYYDEGSGEIRKQDKYFKWKIKAYELQEGEKVENHKVVSVEKPKDGREYWWSPSEGQWFYDDKKEAMRIINNYFPEIDKLKQQVLAIGFDYKGHKQKCRIQDVALLNATRTILQDLVDDKISSNPKMPWSFSDTDTYEIGLQEIKEMQRMGAQFTNLVFAAERLLKSKDPFAVTLVDFKKAMDDAKTIMDNNKKMF